jgi:uncharacterized protein YjbI with pentapeptide repeats
LGGVDFTDAIIAGADLRDQAGPGEDDFSAAQLYSTGSYKNKDLRGIRLGFNDLKGWDFSGIDLTEGTFFNARLVGANFENATVTGGAFHGADLAMTNFRGAKLDNVDLGSAMLTGADLTGAHLSNADLFAAVLTSAEAGDANFSGANLESADLRGARNLDTSSAKVSRAILPDGTVDGLTGFPFVIHNFESGQPIPIRVTGSMRPNAMAMYFNDRPWGSTIEFDPGIPVVFSGSGLELRIEEGANVSAMMGRTFQLFDWTGVVPVGTLRITSAYSWDVSRLYTDGTVTLVPEAGALLPVCLAGVLTRVRVVRSSQKKSRKTRAAP